MIFWVVVTDLSKKRVQTNILEERKTVKMEEFLRNVSNYLTRHSPQDLHHHLCLKSQIHK